MGDCFHAAGVQCDNCRTGWNHGPWFDPATNRWVGIMQLRTNPYTEAASPSDADIERLDATIEELRAELRELKRLFLAYQNEGSEP